MGLSWHTAVQQLPPWRGAHLRLKFKSFVSHAPPHSPRKLIHGKKSNMLALSCLLNCAPHGTMRSLGCFDVEIVLPRQSFPFFHLHNRVPATVPCLFGGVHRVPTALDQSWEPGVLWNVLYMQASAARCRCRVVYA